MASRYYGLNRGQNETDVSEDSSTTSKKVELVVDLASSLDREDVLLALEKIKNYILSHNWPPA